MSFSIAPGVWARALEGDQSIADSPPGRDDAPGRPVDLPLLLPSCLGWRPPPSSRPTPPGRQRPRPHTLFLQLNFLGPSHTRLSVHTGKPQPLSIAQPESRPPGTDWHLCVPPTSIRIPHCWATLTKPLASSPTGTAVGAVTSCRPEAGAPGPPSHAAPASASSASPGPRWRRAGARRCPQGLPG